MYDTEVPGVCTGMYDVTLRKNQDATRKLIYR